MQQLGSVMIGDMVPASAATLKERRNIERCDRRPVICQVLHSLGVGGAEKLAYRMAISLSDRFHFVFACLDETGELGEDLRRRGYVVEELGRRPGLDWGCLRRLATFCHRHHVDVIHAHQFTPYFYSVAPRLRRRPPVVFTEHGRHYPDYRRPKRVLFNRIALRRRDRVVAVGQAVKQALIEYEGFSPERVQVIYNGIELSRFEQVPAEAGAAIRRELSLRPDDFVVAQVGRLDPVKRHDVALCAIGKLRTSCPHVRLLIVGDGPERERIEQLIDELQLREHVRMLGTRHDVPRILAAADVGLLTSDSEGIPLSLIEMMAAGRPVVATAVGGVPEVVQDGATGLLCRPRDEMRIAQHLMELYHNREHREDLTMAARHHVYELFSESAMLEQYVTMYQSAAGVPSA